MTGTPPVRFVVVGCGDVAFRHYLPALASMDGRVQVAALVDRRAEARDRAAATIAAWSPGVRTFERLEDALASGPLDAAINLTPAPAHAPVSRLCLEGGLHVYSEKPIAGTLADADALIDIAARLDRVLSCAPGVAVTRRFEWLASIVDSGRLGPLTLAVAHHADTGPATWREYTGDPTVFYAEGVGPVFDHGVYRLHGMTHLLGPVRRVQAMGTIAAPTRLVRAGPLTGKTIPVTTPDHVLMNLEFANGALGQLLTSFAAPATRAPWLELQFSHGTISFAGASSDKDDPASLYVDDEGPLGLDGWIHGLRPPPPDELDAVVETGITHFVACLTEGTRAVLTAEHARHVLDIILKAYASIDDGRSHETETTFMPARPAVPAG